MNCCICLALDGHSSKVTCSSRETPGLRATRWVKRKRKMKESKYLSSHFPLMLHSSFPWWLMVIVFIPSKFQSNWSFICVCLYPFLSTLTAAFSPLLSSPFVRVPPDCSSSAYWGVGRGEGTEASTLGLDICLLLSKCVRVVFWGKAAAVDSLLIVFVVLAVPAFPSSTVAFVCVCRWWGVGVCVCLGMCCYAFPCLIGGCVWVYLRERDRGRDS